MPTDWHPIALPLPAPDVRRRASHVPPAKLAREVSSGSTRLLQTEGEATRRGQELGLRGRLRLWMVNEGYSTILVGVWVLLNVLIVMGAFLTYGLGETHASARKRYTPVYFFARSGAFCMEACSAFIMLPFCRTLITWAKSTPLNTLIPFEKGVAFHKIVAWTMIGWAILHSAGHVVLDIYLAVHEKAGFSLIVERAFLSVSGITGWIMDICLAVMAWFAVERNRRRPNGGYERFWYSHHLFILFFIGFQPVAIPPMFSYKEEERGQIHVMPCNTRPDFNYGNECKNVKAGNFWKYILVPGVLYAGERLLRFFRSRQKRRLIEVIQHPSDVMEIKFQKLETRTVAGQYIFINCPEIDPLQWHPFTLTSAPEEDYLSLHMRIVGDWTTAFATRLGCDFRKKPVKNEKDARKAVQVADDTKVVGLPHVVIDGPFGTASEDVFKFEVAVLVGAGIGVTPFSSILKSIFYRHAYPDPSKPNRLSKVYFFWVIRDFGSLEWFHSLLHEIEEQDLGHLIEIHTYLTAKLKPEDIENVVLNTGDRDPISGLRAPTHFGRPNWDRIFQSVTDTHPDTDCGVFFCGPPVLATELHNKCNKYTHPDGTRFFFGKEQF